MTNNDQRKRQLAQADEHCREAVSALRAACHNLQALAPVDALREMDEAKVALELAERQTVAHLRSFGSTWQEIADALHITRQTAWARYSPNAPR